MSRVSRVVFLSLLLLCAILVLAFNNYLVFGDEQEQCFAMAMVGMDSVINARLGVRPEDVLDLASLAHNKTVADTRYDNHLLNVILDAYLWSETPHSYAVSVFFKCATRLGGSQRADAGQ